MFDLRPLFGSTRQLMTTGQTRLGSYALICAVRAVYLSRPSCLFSHPFDPFSVPTTSFPILLVDDEPEIADILRQAAKRDFPEARFEYVQRLADVLPYLAEPTTSPPRLILLDIDLGVEQTGIDLIAQLRRHPKSHMVPIVMLSASQSRDTVMESYQRGANAFTHKPYDYSEWKQYVQNLRAYWFDAVTTLVLPRKDF